MAGTVTVSNQSFTYGILSFQAQVLICAGGAGLHVFSSSSTIGVNYQLMLGTTPIGSPIAGTSGSLDFGAQTNAGSYTIVQPNCNDRCVNNMTGSATISINPLPASFFTYRWRWFLPGRIWCPCRPERLSYRNNIPVAPCRCSGLARPLAGTGAALDFGPELQQWFGFYTAC